MFLISGAFNSGVEVLLRGVAGRQLGGVAEGWMPLGGYCWDFAVSENMPVDGEFLIKSDGFILVRIIRGLHRGLSLPRYCDNSNDVMGVVICWGTIIDLGVVTMRGEASNSSGVEGRTRLESFCEFVGVSIGELKSLSSNERRAADERFLLPHPSTLGLISLEGGVLKTIAFAAVGKGLSSWIRPVE